MESGCNDDDPECMCPCQCGCQNGEGGMDLPFVDTDDATLSLPTGEWGICQSCALGMHEIPRDDSPSLIRMAVRHEDVARQLRSCAEYRRQEDTETTFPFMDTLPMLHNGPLDREAARRRKSIQ